MTDENMLTIQEMRYSGKGYKTIAKKTGISESTIKTYCHRHGLDRAGLIEHVIMPDLKSKQCDNCGAQFTLYPGRKVPRFCCSACRIKWWNTHQPQSTGAAMISRECPSCGEQFRAYRGKSQKYCSHPCYITARFG